MKLKIYEKLQSRYPEPLPGFDEIVLSQLRQRTEKIFNYLEDRENRLDVKCHNCNDKYARSGYTEIVYEELFYDKTKSIDSYFCSEGCAESVSEFTFICDRCGLTFYNEFLSLDGDVNLCNTCHADNILEFGMFYDEIGKHDDYILAALRQRPVGSHFKFIKILHEHDVHDIVKTPKMLGLKDEEFLIIPVRNKNRDRHKFYIKEKTLKSKEVDLEFAMKMIILASKEAKKSYIAKN